MFSYHHIPLTPSQEAPGSLLGFRAIFPAGCGHSTWHSLFTPVPWVLPPNGHRIAEIWIKLGCKLRKLQVRLLWIFWEIKSLTFHCLWNRIGCLLSLKVLVFYRQNMHLSMSASPICVCLTTRSRSRDITCTVLCIWDGPIVSWP